MTGPRRRNLTESGATEHYYTPGRYAVLFCDPEGIKLKLLDDSGVLGAPRDMRGGAGAHRA
jgi:hypothetical protein